MDFFDGAYQVVVCLDHSIPAVVLILIWNAIQIGGSYATIPRISERKSVRNWYQRNYPYPWVGGRLVYDVSK